MRRAARSLFVFHALTVFGLTSVSTPGQAAESTEDARARSRAEFRLGAERLRAKDFAAAVDHFAVAVKSDDRPQTLRKLAQAQVLAGRLLEANASYRSLLGRDLDAAERASVLKEVVALQSRLALVTIEVPSESEISVDNARIDSMPAALEPGAHELLVRKPGHVPYSSILALAAGEQKTVRVELAPEPRKPEVTIRAVDDFQGIAIVDGQAVGSLPWTGAVEPGRHELGIASETHRSAPQTVEVVSDQRYTYEIEPVLRTAVYRIAVQPANAQIVIDGKTLGQGTWRGDVTYGQHQVQLRAPGFVTLARLVSIAHDTPTEGSFELTPSVPTPVDRAQFTPEKKQGAPDGHGFFGGIGLFGGAQTAGAVSFACAAPCQASQPLPAMGAALIGDVGYRLGYVSPEIVGSVRGTGQVATNSNAGSASSLPVPTDRSEEVSAVYGMGWFGGAGARAAWRTGFVHLSFGAAMGATVYSLTFRHEYQGLTSESSQVSQSFTTPTLVLRPAIALGSSPGVRFRLGAVAWFDFLAGDVNVVTPSSPAVTRLIAHGTQVYIGPELGLDFGR